MVDAVLLEWEGVLADTRRARRDALRQALATEGVAHTLSDDDEQLRGLGVAASVRVVMRHMGCADPTLADLLVLRATRAFGDTLAAGALLAPGATAFVERMQSCARVAVVTRASRAETEMLLRMAGLDDAVTTIVSSDDGPADAAAGARFADAIGRLSRTRAVAPARAIAVVDAVPAIRAARAAGVRVVTVGAPAHEAVEADAAFERLGDVTMDDVLALAATRGGRHSA